MSILIKGTNIEDLQRAMLLFRGHEIIELPDHGGLIDKDVLLQHVVEIIPQKVFDFVPVVIPAERSRE